MDPEHVGPTEDVVQALMETLVDPKLPYCLSITEPSADVQNSIAKQMHAVVLLYNYYYRKKKPELEFLNFVSFCKLAISRIAMTLFMRPTCGSEQNFDIDRLTVTEKAVKDACDIAASLDASRDFPNLESWPISKVAILVIDSEKENCLLRFGSATEGVWSLLEKDLDSNLEILVSGESKVGMKRKSSIQKASDNCKLLEIAFDAVKGIAGIDRVDLVVLETHYTYSLSKQKSAVKFYMMQYCKTFKINQRTPLKLLVESLRGPLVKKYDDGWETTDFVVYHEMLPYVRFISNWLSRKDLCLPSLNDQNAPNISNSSPPRRTSQNAVTKNTPNTFTKRSEVADSVKEEKIINSDIFDIDNYEHLKGSLSGTSKGLQNITGYNKSSSDSWCTRKKLNSRQQVCNLTSAQRGSDTADHSKPNATLALVQFQADSDIKLKNKQDSVESHCALALLNNIRLELTSKIEIMEDELILSEDCIERIRDGGDVDLARQCSKSILSGNYDLLPKTEVQKQTEFPNIFLPGRCSRQDLDYTCLKNNWRLPRYIVEPCDGKFLSMVVVGSKDFELSLKGDLENSPREARESGAAQMIGKLRERFSGY